MRRFTPLMLPGWRYLAVPLAIWVVLVLGGAAGVSWIIHAGRMEQERRFQLRVTIASEFVSIYIADLLNRERAQAQQFLADPAVDAGAFQRSVAAFGYPAAVLLDSSGRLLHVVPPNPAKLGTDLTGEYEHLRVALRENRPAVSSVVAAAGSGQPVVAIAIPFDTPGGRRVFSGAIEVRDSPLGGYLAHAIALTGSSVFLIDGNSMVLGSDRLLTGQSRLDEREPRLAAALGRHASGQYTRGEGDRSGVRGSRPQRGQSVWWFDSTTVPGTPWRLVGAVPLATLYGPFAEVEAWSRGTLLMAALFGLAGVGFAGRAARNRSELRDSEERFRGLFDGSLVPMLLSEPHTGRLLRVNQALADLLGYSAEELLASDWQRLTHPDDLAVSRTLARAALAGLQRGFALEKRYLHADGHVVPVSLTCTLITDARGRPRHFATQIIDISERHRLAAAQRQARNELATRASELELANAALQAAQQRTADLVAMLSHDVRQPLGVITGYCELLLEAWDHTEDRHKRRDLARIAQAGTGMMQLVEEILTLTELDNADLRPRRSAITVERAVEAALGALFVGAGRSVDIDVPAELAVLADPRHVQQVLVNLLSNAHKYGGPGISVSARLDGETVEICVADRGEGVPPEFVSHLFERYARADSGVAPTRSGTGLGLYIARQLIEANGGDIRYRPGEPQGSRFLVRLPAAVPAGALVQATPSADHSA